MCVIIRGYRLEGVEKKRIDKFGELFYRCGFFLHIHTHYKRGEEVYEKKIRKL